ncbi:MAG: SEC-C metal-binding domain-containing protein [Thermodesulfobacteriota bacterium]
MANTTTPQKITNKIREFCRSISPHSIPIYVPVKAHRDSQFDECFSNVREYVVEKGGQLYFGYTIWEWPNVLLEAEFHCVWKSDQEELIDITKKRENEKRILFLPDESKSFNFDEPAREPSVRLPLVNDPFVEEFVDIANTIDSFSRKPGPVHVPEPLLRRQAFLLLTIWAQTTGRNDKCPCGSGAKFKKCCLRKLHGFK